MREWWQDFITFRRFITPQVIPVVFWIGVAIAVISGLIAIVEGALAGCGGCVFMGIVSLFVGPLFVRILCELVFVLFTFFRAEK